MPPRWSHMARGSVMFFLNIFSHNQWSVLGGMFKRVKQVHWQVPAFFHTRIRWQSEMLRDILGVRWIFSISNIFLHRQIIIFTEEHQNNIAIVCLAPYTQACNAFLGLITFSPSIFYLLSIIPKLVLLLIYCHCIIVPSLLATRGQCWVYRECSNEGTQLTGT